MEKYDLIIVGAGPAGIFTAVELFRRGAHKKILMVEKGQSVEKRSCPKSKTQKCVNCQPCNITTGFSGAGAFSDGKLSLNHEVGGDFPNLVGPDFAQSLIDYTDQIYLEFGADPHVEGVSDPDKIRIIRRRAIRAGLKLVDCPIRHLGTEKAQELYLALENDLRAKGVDHALRPQLRRSRARRPAVQGRHRGADARRHARDDLCRRRRHCGRPPRRGMAGIPVREV